MAHSITTTINRSARRANLRPTIAELKKFIDDTEEAGIDANTKVTIEMIGQVIGFTYNLSADQRDEVPETSAAEPEAEPA